MTGPLHDQDPTPTMPDASCLWSSFGGSQYVVSQIVDGVVLTVSGSPSD